MSHIKDRDIAKALQASTNKYMRKSQTDFTKVTPQSKLRYSEAQDLSVGAHNLMKNDAAVRIDTASPIAKFG